MTIKYDADMTNDKWKPESYLQGSITDQIDKCDWSIYMKSKEHDPYFAISIDGQVFFKGEQVDKLPGIIAERIMEAFLENYKEARKDTDLKIKQVFGLVIEIE